MAKRSPRYPRQSLSKALEMTRKLFEGGHQSRMDVDTAAKVIGYSSSTGGAAASAIGALRQFGLVDGLRGDVSVSELAMRILQPLNEHERAEAMREAAAKPEIFGKIMSQFSGRLPASDEPVRALLIRQEGFSTGGANELIGTLRETLNALPTEREVQSSMVEAAEAEMPQTLGDEVEKRAAFPNSSHASDDLTSQSELIVLPLGSGCRAELRFIGEVSATAYGRLIRHLELLKESLDQEEKEDW